MRLPGGLPLLASGCALLALLAAGCSDGDEGEPPRPALERHVVGRGAAGATVLLPRRQTLPTVVFLHGWGAVDPRNYEPWLEHLARRGSAVVYPRYQTSALALPTTVLANAVLGVRAGLARAGARRWVAAGHSAGGALAADLAARAAAEDLPSPLAVFSAFPGRGLAGLPFRIPSADLSRIRPSVRILTLSGAMDRVVGGDTARAIVRDARRVPERHRLHLVVTRQGAADHLAPQRASRVSREEFWQRLDRLIEETG